MDITIDTCPLLGVASASLVLLKNPPLALLSPEIHKSLYSFNSFPIVLSVKILTKRWRIPHIKFFNENTMSTDPIIFNSDLRGKLLQMQWLVKLFVCVQKIHTECILYSNPHSNEFGRVWIIVRGSYSKLYRKKYVVLITHTITSQIIMRKRMGLWNGVLMV